MAAGRGTATFRGHRAIDGGVLRFHPYRAAMLDGCTHILHEQDRGRPLDGAPIGLPGAHLALELGDVQVVPRRTAVRTA